MDAIVDGRPVTPRDGFVVEINALWYNAVCQALEWAANRDSKFVERWAPLPELISGSFNALFWDQQRGYLADYFNEHVRDMSVRPNQVLAVSMDHSPLTIEMKKSILDVIERELLTPRGLRSLSPKHEAYQGVYEGDQVKRDSAYHQGTVYPWLSEHFIKGFLGVHKRSGYHLVKRYYEGFDEALTSGGIGSISEVYDGNPPHLPKGGISQATAVAALLRIGEMTERFKQ
jgi:predicted glycogen debranching enzyme